MKKIIISLLLIIAVGCSSGQLYFLNTSAADETKRSDFKKLCTKGNYVVATNFDFLEFPHLYPVNIYKNNNNVLQKIKCLTKRGQFVQYKNGKIYYAKFSSYFKPTLYSCNIDGGHNRKLAKIKVGTTDDIKLTKIIKKSIVKIVIYPEAYWPHSIKYNFIKKKWVSEYKVKIKKNKLKITNWTKGIHRSKKIGSKKNHYSIVLKKKNIVFISKKSLRGDFSNKLLAYSIKKNKIKVVAKKNFNSLDGKGKYIIATNYSFSDALATYPITLYKTKGIKIKKVKKLTNKHGRYVNYKHGKFYFCKYLNQRQTKLKLFAYDTKRGSLKRIAIIKNKNPIYVEKVYSNYLASVQIENKSGWKSKRIEL